MTDDDGREPTPDEAAGIAWWSALTDGDRNKWASIAQAFHGEERIWPQVARPEKVVHESFDDSDIVVHRLI